MFFLGKVLTALAMFFFGGGLVDGTSTDHSRHQYLGTNRRVMQIRGILYRSLNIKHYLINVNTPDAKLPSSEAPRLE